MVREIKKINMSNELIYKFLYTWRWKHKWQMDNHTVVCVFVCVPIITGAVLLRYAISKLRHWDKYPDWLGFSLRGVALRRSLSRYITSLKKEIFSALYVTLQIHQVCLMVTGLSSAPYIVSCSAAWLSETDPLTRTWMHTNFNAQQ